MKKRRSGTTSCANGLLARLDPWALNSGTPDGKPKRQCCCPPHTRVRNFPFLQHCVRGSAADCQTRRLQLVWTMCLYGPTRHPSNQGTVSRRSQVLATAVFGPRIRSVRVPCCALVHTISTDVPKEYFMAASQWSPASGRDQRKKARVASDTGASRIATRVPFRHCSRTSTVGRRHANTKLCLFFVHGRATASRFGDVPK